MSRFVKVGNRFVNINSIQEFVYSNGTLILVIDGQKHNNNVYTATEAEYKSFINTLMENPYETKKLQLMEKLIKAVEENIRAIDENTLANAYKPGGEIFKCVEKDFKDKSS